MVTMVRRRIPLASVVFAAGLLIHCSLFKSLHEAVVDESSRIEAESEIDRDAPSHVIVDNAVRNQTSHQVNPSLIANVSSRYTDYGESHGDTLDESDYTDFLHEDNEPVHLVYSSDKSSVPGVLQSILSVMHYATGPVVFHFVGDLPLSLPLSPPNKIKFYNITTVGKQFKLQDFTNPRVRVEKDRKTLNSNIPNYVRFIMASLLPPNITKAMWIDADTIVKCDVVSMMKNVLTGESDHAIAAVAVKGKPQSLARWVKKDYSYIKKTFNAGVFVANLHLWRQQNLTQQIRDLTLSNRRKHIYKYGSQPPLTLIIGNDFEHLNASWNVKVPLMNKYFKDHGNDADVCLLHWVGGSKPWDGHGQFKQWWKDYGLKVNREEMVKEATRLREAKARKWKQKVAEKKAKRLQATNGGAVD